MTGPSARRWPALSWGIAAVAYALLHTGLLDNPGYFSHDELQWAARADVSSIALLPWEGWTAFETFQYRPLTFNLWLLISHVLFDQPRLYHALWLALGFANAGLLYACLRGLQVAPRQAAAGSAAFALSPYAVYVHGWTATLADLLWVGAALAGLALLLRLPRQSRWLAALLGLVGSSVALLSKEAGLAILPLLVLGWLFSARDSRWRFAVLGSALPTLAYLGLRLPTLLFAPRPEGAYGWSLLSPPLRWAEMQLYPFMPTALEFSSVANGSLARLGVALALAMAIGIASWTANRRIGFIHLVGGAIAMGPALLLHTGYPQYGYGFAALCCGCLACAWPQIGRAGRVAVGLALLVSIWHGLNVQRELNRIGQLQARFSPQLAAALSGHPVDGPLRIAPEVSADTGIYRRLTQPVHSYAGVLIEARVEVVELQQPHAARISADGTMKIRTGSPESP